MCANQGMEDSGRGVRFFEGSWADVFLWRSGRVRGYAVAIWKHGHVAEPTQLPAEQAAGFWLQTLRAGAAIEAHLAPVKLNYLTLGNALPHLHTTSCPGTPTTRSRAARCRSTSWTTAGSRRSGCGPMRWPCGRW
jgi:diadenosine tetraphosphate (Ap4A) HIT family hydrolase